MPLLFSLLFSLRSWWFVKEAGKAAAGDEDVEEVTEELMSSSSSNHRSLITFFPFLVHNKFKTSSSEPFKLPVGFKMYFLFMLIYTGEFLWINTVGCVSIRNRRVVTSQTEVKSNIIGIMHTSPAPGVHKAGHLVVSLSFSWRYCCFSISLFIFTSEGAQVWGVDDLLWKGAWIEI